MMLRGEDVKLNRSVFFFALTIGVLSVVMWALLNQPDQEPPWPPRVKGFSFAPMRAEHDPAQGTYPSTEQIDEDLRLLASHARAVRTYSVADTLGEIPVLAKKHGLYVALGAWIGPDATANEGELERLLEVYRENLRTVVRVIVGNEAILRKEQTPDQLIAYLDYLQKTINAPISTAEPWHIWLKYPELAEHVDFIAVHILPYWEGISVDYAITFLKERYRLLREAFPDKPIVIAEVGWPSRGRTREAAKASLANQAKFLRRFLAEAQREGYDYYILEAFDQIWKHSIEGNVGSSWGVYNSGREAKFAFTEPVVRVPQWRGLAGICIGVAVIVLALLFRDSRGLRYRGRWFLTLDYLWGRYPDGLDCLRFYSALYDAGHTGSRNADDLGSLWYLRRYYWLRPMNGPRPYGCTEWRRSVRQPVGKVCCSTGLDSCAGLQRAAGYVKSNPGCIGTTELPQL